LIPAVMDNFKCLNAFSFEDLNKEDAKIYENCLDIQERVKIG